LKYSGLIKKCREATRYNQIVATVRVNIITSRGEGKDSLFDADQKHAFKAITRLREACFYHEGLDSSERENCIDSIKEDLWIHSIPKTPLTPEEKKELLELLPLMEKNTKGFKGETNTKMTYLMDRIRNLPGNIIDRNCNST
jgi:hypothetical protein